MKKVLIPINLILAVLIVITTIVLVLINVSGAGNAKVPSDEEVALAEGNSSRTTEYSGDDFELDANYAGQGSNQVSNEETAGDSDENTNSSDPLDDPDGYIFPNSDRVLMTEDDLRDYSPMELTYGRNEIYARHGYIFESQELNDYFGSKNWYVPNPHYKAGDDFNEYESKNGDMIREYQNSNNKTYKPQ